MLHNSLKAFFVFLFLVSILVVSLVVPSFSKQVRADINGWTQLIPDGDPNSPPARRQHSTVWDTQNHRMLMFGGCCTFNDLWQYTSGGGWELLTEQEASGSPGTRWYPGLVWDMQDNRMLLFGGFNGPTWYNDLWQYTTSGGWQQIIDNDDPNAPWQRFGHSVVWDSQENRLLLFGGHIRNPSTNLQFFGNDLWQYTTSGGWELLTAQGDPSSPASRRYHTAVWDTQANRLLIFGGNSDEVYNDLWQYTTSGGWQELTPQGSPDAPSPRSDHESVWDTQHNRMLVFAGCNFVTICPAVYNDLWQYTTSGGWELLTVNGDTNSPEGRISSAAAWDTQENRMLVFAGAGETNFIEINDLWQYKALPPTPTSTPTPTPTVTPTPTPTNTPTPTATPTNTPTPTPIPAPTSIQQCQNGGWMTFTNPSFQNQGQCIHYVNTH